MLLFLAVEAKLDKALKDAEIADFADWDTRQTYLIGYRKALREILALKPEK